MSKNKYNKVKKPSPKDGSNAIPKPTKLNGQELKACLEASRRGEGKINDDQITNEELTKIEKAFESEEFCHLFSEYIQEISDPKNRAEQNELLRQMERDSMESIHDKLIVQPKVDPHLSFVVKFKYTSMKKSDDGPFEKKAFVNIVCSDKMDPPTFTPCSQEKEKMFWSIPHCVGPLRLEIDSRKNSSTAPTCDCCFNPQSLERAQRNPKFRQILINIAKNGIEQRISHKSSDEEVSFDNKFAHILKGVSYRFDEPPIMVIQKPTSSQNLSSKPKPEGGSAESRDTAFKSSSKAKILKTGFLNNKRNDNKQVKSNAPQKAGLHLAKNSTCEETASGFGLTEISSKTLNSSTSGEVSKESDYVVPNYTLTEREVHDIMPDDDAVVKSTRPEFMVVQVYLPRVKDPASIDLDLMEQRLELVTRELSRPYRLLLRLPYPSAHNKEISAKWNARINTLNVTIPVQAQKLVPITIYPSTSGAVSSQRDALEYTKSEIDASKEKGTRKDSNNLSLHSRWVTLQASKEETRAEFATDVMIPVAKGKLNNINCEEAQTAANTSFESTSSWSQVDQFHGERDDITNWDTIEESEFNSVSSPEKMEKPQEKMKCRPILNDHYPVFPARSEEAFELD